MPVPYYGDFPEDFNAVNIPFNTFDSNDPSASVTITDLADADIKVHKDAHVDQIVTDGATVVINFDGITGNNMINIDTSVDAAYATGSEYQVRIEGTTVDGGTINAFVGTFSIERAGGALALIKAGVTLAADAIKAVSYDESTAFPLKADDAGATQIARVGADGDTLETLSDQIDLQATLAICTEARLAELDGANLPTDIADIPTVAEFEARTIVAANYVVVGDTLARVTLVDTVTDNTDLVTAAAIKTAMEADGGDLSSLMEGLINKVIIEEATGTAEMFNDAGVSQGTVVAAFTTDGTYTTRLRMFK